MVNNESDGVAEAVEEDEQGLPVSMTFIMIELYTLRGICLFVCLVY